MYLHYILHTFTYIYIAYFFSLLFPFRGLRASLRGRDGVKRFGGGQRLRPSLCEGFAWDGRRPVQGQRELTETVIFATEVHTLSGCVPEHSFAHWPRHAWHRRRQFLGDARGQIHKRAELI